MNYNLTVKSLLISSVPLYDSTKVYILGYLTQWDKRILLYLPLTAIKTLKIYTIITP